MVNDFIPKIISQLRDSDDYTPLQFDITCIAWVLSILNAHPNTLLYNMLLQEYTKIVYAYEMTNCPKTIEELFKRLNIVDEILK